MVAVQCNGKGFLGELYRLDLRGSRWWSESTHQCEVDRPLRQLGKSVLEPGLPDL